jgi:hypothetical protein
MSYLVDLVGSFHEMNFQFVPRTSIDLCVATGFLRAGPFLHEECHPHLSG